MAFTPTRIPSVPARLRTALLALTALVPLAGLLAPPAVAAGRTPTHEDIWLLKRVGAPVASPDGRWAVISVTDPAYDDTQASDLWLVPTDGSAAPRRLTATRAGESGAAWSPDSRQLAFSAKREGDDAPQIYLLDIARGGEAQRVTSLVIGARAPQFSPDGKQLLFVANPYPGAITDAETSMTPLYRNRAAAGVGAYNYGNVRNDKADELAGKSSIEGDPVKREALVKAALKAYRESIVVIPLHRQVIPWAVRNHVTPVHKADNYVELRWFKVGPK